MAVGQHAREVPRDACAVWAHGLQSNRLPVARHLAVEQALQHHHEVVHQAHVVLQDECHGPGALALQAGHDAHGPEVRSGAADRADDASAVPRVVEALLRLCEVEVLREEALIPGRLERQLRCEVHAGDALERDAELRKPLRDEVPALSVLVQVHDVHGDVLLEPLPGLLGLAVSDAARVEAIVLFVADARLQQGLQVGVTHWRAPQGVGPAPVAAGLVAHVPRRGPGRRAALALLRLDERRGVRHAALRAALRELVIQPPGIGIERRGRRRRRQGGEGGKQRGAKGHHSLRLGGWARPYARRLGPVRGLRTGLL
mmetsp:Transcript_36096/g.93053  ORF Transcript_36096/g.93053 Transcript_36096/m.93053 type:complete len:315 (+) Transcript_36096:1482-2426(+)